MTAIAPVPATAARAAPTPSTRSPWFHSAAFDLPLILLVPLFTWPLVLGAQHAFGADLVTKLILLTATGHYFATFARAYGDRELLARFPLRFLLVPPIVFATCIAMWATGRSAPLVLLVGLWGFWHWLAQAFGFARIYDSKVGSFRPLTAFLDKALVVGGFVGVVVLCSGPTATFAKLFVDAGLPLPSAAAWVVVQAVVAVALGAIAIAYVANLARTLVRGEPWSWQKQVMHVTTIGYYWFAFTYLPNVLVAYVLYELFHDIQYYAITWLACTQRAKRPQTTRWFARMFRPGPATLLAFLAAMTVFGAADLAGRNLTGDGWMYSGSVAVFSAAAVLHYYFDGFIWKARESALAADLGIAGGLRANAAPALRHGGRWAFFFVPLAAMLALAAVPLAPRERAEALVAIAPHDFVSQAELGAELLKARDFEAAYGHYRASIAANPDYAIARFNYACTLDLAGDADAAIEQYRHALRCEEASGLPVHPAAHTNLGVLLWLRGDRKTAGEHFAASARLGGEPPAHRMLGMAAALPPTATARRAQLWSGALQLEPQNLDARLGLGGVYLQQRRFDEAIRQYTAVLQQRADAVPALVGLGCAQAELGLHDDARATLDRALQIAPDHAEARALRARLGR
jgi:tetratricopeptide (TPR) repeat protein